MNTQPSLFEPTGAIALWGRASSGARWHLVATADARFDLLPRMDRGKYRDWIMVEGGRDPNVRKGASTRASA